MDDTVKMDANVTPVDESTVVDAPDTKDTSGTAAEGE